MGRFLIIIGLLVSFGSCHELNDTKLLLVAPIADFDYSREGMDCNSPVEEIVFTNRSQFANQIFWDFGDGTTSTETNPRKIYQTEGTYRVKLTAISKEKNDVVTKDVIFGRDCDGLGPVVGLTYTRLSTTSLTLSFTVKAPGASKCLINFGDGGIPFQYTPTSNSQNITHTYAGPGSYVATLTASNSEGQNYTEVFFEITP